MDWFLYNSDLRHKRVNILDLKSLRKPDPALQLSYSSCRGAICKSFFPPFCSKYCLENGLPERINVSTFIKYHSQVSITFILQQLQFQKHLLDFHVTNSNVSFEPFEAAGRQELERQALESTNFK